MLQGQSIDGELLERAQPLALLEALLADAATAAGPATPCVAWCETAPTRAA